MFSKSRPDAVPQPAPTPPGLSEAPDPRASFTPSAPAKAKPAPSVLSSDITVVGNLKSSGDIHIEGTIEGDVRSQIVIVGESATVRGEVVGEEVVVHGRVVGRLRGVKVRLSATARVEGDIVHKTIAIENGAHFEGSVQRQDDPIAQGAQQPARITGPGGSSSRVQPPQPAAPIDRLPEPHRRGAARALRVVRLDSGRRLVARRGRDQRFAPTTGYWRVVTLARRLIALLRNDSRAITK